MIKYSAAHNRLVHGERRKYAHLILLHRVELICTLLQGKRAYTLSYG